MLDKMTNRMGFHITLLGLLCSFSPALLAADVGLAGVMGSKAMLMINGGQPKALAVGQSIDGIRLISVSGDQVVVEINGKHRPLRIGQHAVGTLSAGGAEKVILTADSRGHFLTTGAVNGASITFLVDTGATMVSLGASDARRLGIDASKGQPGMSSTANGIARVSKVKLDSVRVGDVTLNNVDALIGETDMPHALLGMSFLNRMEMQRDGPTMTLKRRF
jgi:aspartyl protease family protein